MSMIGSDLLSMTLHLRLHNSVAFFKNVCHPVFSSVQCKKTTPASIFWTEMLKTALALAAQLLTVISLWAPGETVSVNNKHTN